MAVTDEKASICPLCGGDNDCAAAAGRPVQNCWCWSVILDSEALAAIPPESVDRHCICAACGKPQAGRPDGR